MESQSLLHKKITLTLEMPKSVLNLAEDLATNSSSCRTAEIWKGLEMYGISKQ